MTPKDTPSRAATAGGASQDQAATLRPHGRGGPPVPHEPEPEPCARQCTTRVQPGLRCIPGCLELCPVGLHQAMLRKRGPAWRLQPTLQARRIVVFSQNTPKPSSSLISHHPGAYVCPAVHVFTTERHIGVRSLAQDCVTKRRGRLWPWGGQCRARALCSALVPSRPLWGPSLALGLTS